MGGPRNPFLMCFAVLAPGRGPRWAQSGPKGFPEHTKRRLFNQNASKIVTKCSHHGSKMNQGVTLYAWVSWGRYPKKKWRAFLPLLGYGGPTNQPTNQPKLSLSPSIRTLAKRISAYTTKISKSAMLILQWFGEYLQESTRYAEVQHRIPKIQLYMFFWKWNR